MDTIIERPYRRKTLAQSFWGRVKKTKGCWLWIGNTAPNGYGLMMENRIKKSHSVHRVSWTIHFGEIPYGMCVLHKCDVRNCVNPKHLFLGTYKDNAKDAVNKNRHPHGETHGRSKLKEADVLEIRRLHKSGGFTFAHLGSKFSVDPHQAWLIVKRKAWAHI